VRDACSQKVSKNPKIVCAQVTLTKTGLSAVRTFSPLGVKRFKINYMVIHFYCIHQSHKKRTIPTRSLSSGHHVQEAIEVIQTTFR
jgi:hypothetical protein